MNRDGIQKLLSTLPESPGCYLYFDQKGKVIYVGKAVNLRRRVSSYFNKEIKDVKTKRLVASIADLKYFVVETETDALILENNLIKTYNPRYNILLKDGSSYPYIVITKEEFPRAFLSRNVDRLKHYIYGPFTDVGRAREILKVLRETFKIRTCNLVLSQDKVAQGRFNTCLQYHIKKCLAPCVGYVSLVDYREDLNLAKQILEGNATSLLRTELEQMQQCAEQLQFEQAEEHRKKYELLSGYMKRHSVSSPELGDLSVFSYTEKEDFVFICMMQVKHGAVVRIITDAWKRVLDEEKEELFASIITDMLRIYPFPSQEVLVNIPLPWSFVGERKSRVSCPLRGEKRRLVQLATANAERYMRDRITREEKLNPEQRSTKLMKKMMQDLSLSVPPRHIECFDNSNIQGTNPVAACVVFRNGRPSRKEYRKFHVKTVEGPDDYSSMYEIVTRRYSRVLNEDGELPDLIVIDGGKGQLHVASEALKNLGLFGKIPIVGLAERLEELFFPGEQESLYLKRNSETLNVLRHIRDEAHRFGITFHRLLRSKQQIKSELDEIPGVGVKTREKLLKQFGSLMQIKKASLEEIQACIGIKLGRSVYDFLHAKSVLQQLVQQ